MNNVNDMSTIQLYTNLLFLNSSLQGSPFQFSHSSYLSSFAQTYSQAFLQSLLQTYLPLPAPQINTIHNPAFPYFCTLTCPPALSTDISVGPGLGHIPLNIQPDFISQPGPSSSLQSQKHSLVAHSYSDQKNAENGIFDLEKSTLGQHFSNIFNTELGSNYKKNLEIYLLNENEKGLEAKYRRLCTQSKREELLNDSEKMGLNCILGNMFMSLHQTLSNNVNYKDSSKLEATKVRLVKLLYFSIYCKTLLTKETYNKICDLEKRQKNIKDIKDLESFMHDISQVYKKNENILRMRVRRIEFSSIKENRNKEKSKKNTKSDIRWKTIKRNSSLFDILEKNLEHFSISIGDLSRIKSKQSLDNVSYNGNRKNYIEQKDVTEGRIETVFSELKSSLDKKFPDNKEVSEAFKRLNLYFEEHKLYFRHEFLTRNIYPIFEEIKLLNTSTKVCQFIAKKLKSARANIATRNTNLIYIKKANCLKKVLENYENYRVTEEDLLKLSR